MLKQYDPQHPGVILEVYVLKNLGISIKQAAQELGIARTTLSNIVNQRSPLTVDVAKRIELWLGSRLTAHSLLCMQHEYELARLDTSKLEVIPRPNDMGPLSLEKAGAILEALSAH